MDHADFFLGRLMRSLQTQTFRDFEIVITKDGKMAENTNSGIKKAKGEIIKIIYMDDYFAHPDSLQNMINNWKGGWMVVGCVHDRGDGKHLDPHVPKYSQDIHKGVNTIGSTSVVAFENKDPIFFDENLSWLIDCDYYKKLYDRYGEPTLLNDLDIAIGVGTHQTTFIMTNEEKASEHEYISKKYSEPVQNYQI